MEKTASTEIIASIIARHADSEGPLLPILNDIQAALGCVDAAAEQQIARELNLSKADIHGVVSFYHDYKSEADARPVVQICRAESCKARGVEGLMDAATHAAGKRVKLATVYCLGLCSSGPAARTGDDLHIRLDEASITKLVENA